VIGDNVRYVTSFAKKESPIETEMLGLEQLEYKTLLKRDTTTLKRLSTRDFTLDIPRIMSLWQKVPFPTMYRMGASLKTYW
jgi:hypothetical protein